MVGHVVSKVSPSSLHVLGGETFILLKGLSIQYLTNHGKLFLDLQGRPSSGREDLVCWTFSVFHVTRLFLSATMFFRSDHHNMVVTFMIHLRLDI